MFAGALAGLTTIAVMMLMAWAGVTFDARRDLEKQTGALLDVWLANIDRGNQLYADLEALPQDDCGSAHLNKLNTLVFKDNHITNIWFFPDGGWRAACSSSFGRFEPAHDFGPPEKANLFKDGRQTWYRVPFDRAEGVDKVTVIKKGRYGVSFFLTGNLATAADDLFFVSNVNAPYEEIYHANGNSELLAQFSSSFGPVFGHVYAHVCGPGETRLCYLTMIPASRVLAENGLLLAIFAAFSLVTGFLVCQRVRRAVRMNNSPAGRVRRAIRNGGKGFEPHFQPIVTLETMKCEGCEVLARFEDAQGKLFPDEFITIIQDQNLTWEFTEIIIAKALKQLIPLLAGRPGFKVGVNFFQADLDDEQIQTVIQSPVFRTATDAQISLNCEILETGIGTGTSIAKSLEYLRSIGCRIAIDDFGTGYSNLAQIKALNPDVVKIDKMFIDDLSTTPDSARGTFFNAILGIADAHAMKVCAEGVETFEQLASLRNREVDYAQGYYFAKPMPIRDFSLYLLEQTLKDKMPTKGRLPKLSPVPSN
ncbi:EAL domain-containing protein [Roseibium sediminicola]|uniref:Cyclic diguanylate phosphodiesterase n=1 Tax=Roseibium sediminicola TaxID=2933272 RepID=A0ABT0GQC0_9HYPH|nr:EAL domain-containing protein [Roseibium sp. CAU 1639]MCK7611618.1 cyclic diguanylate phosphodiesterase [Roseibium sp. CAU 1639]